MPSSLECDNVSPYKENIVAICGERGDGDAVNGGAAYGGSENGSGMGGGVDGHARDGVGDFNVWNEDTKEDDASGYNIEYEQNYKKIKKCFESIQQYFQFGDGNVKI